MQISLFLNPLASPHSSCSKIQLLTRSPSLSLLPPLCPLAHLPAPPFLELPGNPGSSFPFNHSLTQSCPSAFSSNITSSKKFSDLLSQMPRLHCSPPLLVSLQPPAWTLDRCCHLPPGHKLHVDRPSWLGKLTSLYIKQMQKRKILLTSCTLFFILRINMHVPMHRLYACICLYLCVYVCIGLICEHQINRNPNKSLTCWHCGFLIFFNPP